MSDDVHKTRKNITPRVHGRCMLLLRGDRAAGAPYDVAYLQITSSGRFAVHVETVHAGGGAPDEARHDSSGYLIGVAPCEIDVDAIQTAWRTEPLATLISRVFVGRVLDWDGRNCVPVLTPKAQEASDAIRHLLREELDFTIRASDDMPELAAVPTTLRELYDLLESGREWVGAPYKHDHFDWTSLPVFGPSTRSTLPVCGRGTPRR